MSQKGRRRKSPYAVVMIIAHCPYCGATMELHRGRRSGDVVVCHCLKEYEIGRIEGGDDGRA